MKTLLYVNPITSQIIAWTEHYGISNIRDAEGVNSVEVDNFNLPADIPEGYEAVMTYVNGEIKHNTRKIEKGYPTTPEEKIHELVTQIDMLEDQILQLMGVN